MKHYLIRYFFPWNNGDRHGVLRPNGVLARDVNGETKIDPRPWWNYAEAVDVRTRLNAAHGEGSHWIIQEKDA
jgi:hypothetical protein